LAPAGRDGGISIGKIDDGRRGENALDAVAREYIKTHGKDLHGGSLDQYFIHGLGHYVGLFVHDDNDYAVPLGRVWSYHRTGIYIPEEKFGVRIEDMYYVDADGKLVKITAACPDGGRSREGDGWKVNRKVNPCYARLLWYPKQHADDVVVHHPRAQWSGRRASHPGDVCPRAEAFEGSRVHEELNDPEI